MTSSAVGLPVHIAREEFVIEAQLVAHDVVKNAKTVDLRRGSRVPQWGH